MVFLALETLAGGHFFSFHDFSRSDPNGFFWILRCDRVTLLTGENPIDS